jgi:hypothetical protein
VLTTPGLVVHLALNGLLLPMQGSTSREGVTVLVGVTVVDVERGVNIPGQDVVVQGSRIAAVQPTGRRAPAGARVIPLRGRYVIPGLWDMHGHFTVGAWREARDTGPIDSLARTYFFALHAAAGVTGVRDLAGDLDRLRKWAAQPAGAGPPAPRLVPTGQKIGDGPVVPGAPFPVESPQDVAVSVRLLKERGAAHAKLAPDAPGWMIEAAIVACRREGVACIGQPRPDPDSVNLALETHSPVAAASQFKELAATGTWVTPTLVLHDMMLRVGPRHPQSRDSALTPRLPPHGMLPDTRTDAQRARAARHWATFQSMVRELQAAGVGLLAGSDLAQGIPGFSLHLELELLQGAGLTPIEALRTATLNPARYFNATDSLGTVAAGRAADLVVLRGDPLADVGEVGSVELVVSRGRVMPRTELDAMVTQARTALRAIRQRLAAQAGGSSPAR